MWEEGEASLKRPPHHDAAAAKTGRSGVLVGQFFFSLLPLLSDGTLQDASC